MASIVSICNLALSNVGKSNIVSLSEASAEGRLCNQFYDEARRALLQAYPWEFAGKTQALAEITNSKAALWSHAYQRPNDCLKIRRVLDASLIEAFSLADSFMCGSHAYALEGRAIYTNLDPAYLRYTVDAVDPAIFPQLFVDALSWHLAMRLAVPLTRDPKVRAECYKMARMVQAEAAAHDANEALNRSDIPSEFVAARG